MDIFLETGWRENDMNFCAGSCVSVCVVGMLYYGHVASGFKEECGFK